LEIGLLQDTVRNQLDIEALLRPVSDEAPAGSYLGDGPLYDEIREARRSDDPGESRGVWERTLRTAQWDRVEELCTHALTEESKDLQIAAWLLEALAHTRGVFGLRDGLELLLRLTREFWVDLYPSLERGPEFRGAPFVWMNEKAVGALGLVELTASSPVDGSIATWNDWKRWLWLDQLQSRRPNDPTVLEEVGESLSRADFDNLVAETPEAFFLERIAVLDEAIQMTRDLSDFLDQELDPDVTSLTQFRSTLEEIRDWMRTARQSALSVAPGGEAEEDADVSEPPPVPVPEEEATAEAPSVASVISGRQDAYRRLLEAARYLKKIEPHSPTPYLVMKAVSWGDKSLDELLKEFVSQGLNIEALFTILGIDYEG
jgi:type VI secretion system ImpA family protein